MSKHEYFVFAGIIGMFAIVTCLFISAPSGSFMAGIAYWNVIMALKKRELKCDWDKAPDWAKYGAVIKPGITCWFETKPASEYVASGHVQFHGLFKIYLGGIKWSKALDKALERRPS